MRSLVTVAAIGVFAALPTLHAQQPAPHLSLRRVVLYKTGVGYFEHVGRVRGTQSLTIDFNSAQLNDVLKSLTTIDLGDGRIGNVSFNSEAPYAQRIKDLSFPFGPQTTLVDLLSALRGARLEIRSGARTIAGRLLSIDHRQRAKDEPPRDELSLMTDAGLIRSVALTPSISVRLLERDLAQQVQTNLDTLGSNRSPDRRRMTIAAVGTGERDVLVSYISEVPIWKTTYRIVLPSDEGGQPRLHGWAIVDNTIGEDWNGIELSLVAGAPQSFIQQLSRPVYGQRPTVGVLRSNTLQPQVHEGTMNEAVNVKSNARSVVGGVSGGVVAGLAELPPPAAAAAIDRVGIAQRLGDMPSAVQGQNLGDLFEYRVTGPITIRKNESALVPILNADVAVERVSLWSDRVGGARPLRGLWLTNSSGLTLDAGTFTVLDEATFAGEGIIDALKPGEKRLLSYAIDLGVQVESRNGDESQHVSRITIARGVAVQHREQRARKVYTIRNSDVSPRVVVVEHPIRAGWTLTSEVKPVETSLTAYRFSVPVAANSIATLTIDERRPIETRYSISELTDDEFRAFVQASGENEKLRQALGPIQATKALAASLTREIEMRSRSMKAIADDQARLRENMRSLKNSAGEQQLLKRYIGQLNDEEDRLTALGREVNDLSDKRQRAGADLARQIEALFLDLEV
jgi:hypothetical protein